MLVTLKLFSRQPFFRGEAVIVVRFAISHDVEPGKVMSGIPAFENRDWLRSTAAFRKLGDMAGRLRRLEKRVFGNDA